LPFGIIRTFQLASVFQDLSILDNIRVALHYSPGRFSTDLVRAAGVENKEDGAVREKAMKLLNIAV